MARLMNNLAKKTNNFEQADKELAYGIFIVEHEFNVGPIDEDFLAMKFFNLIDKENGERFENESKGDSAGGIPNTMG